VIDEDAIRLRYEALDPFLDERSRRRFAAAEARSAGHGGVTAVSRITGVARSTIGRGLKEIRGEAVDPAPRERLRRVGGGRKPLTATDATLLDDLRGLLDPVTRGDPMAPLLWTAKSAAKLARGLQELGHGISANSVAALLRGLGYSLQANRKTKEGTNHPDRDAQFHYINTQVQQALAAKEPVISVDTKKKELVGDFKNAGREYRPKGQPEAVRVHDFVIPELGRAAPYGVYDIADNTGWVSVGIDHDTGAFAVNAIRRWWQTMGQKRYRGARRLLINADGGGSNGSRVRLWKLELQLLANELNLEITVCHLPPGTSKWNKIEHRMFSFISQNWRARPLLCYRTIVQLIAATTTDTGLTIQSELDTSAYPKGIKISDAEMAGLNLHRHQFHGDWNYTIKPNIQHAPALASQ
jgi:Rhodopirellula transposase DDE domain